MNEAGLADIQPGDAFVNLLKPSFDAFRILGTYRINKVC